jgi:hypothetical protein
VKKYILAPGHVRSKNDGQLHYIGYAALCRLYGVHIGECVFAEDIGMRARLNGDEIWLRPREDGNYQKVQR